MPSSKYLRDPRKQFLLPIRVIRVTIFRIAITITITIAITIF